MSVITGPSTAKGREIYNPWSLRLHDLWAIYFSNRFIWRCPKKHILEHCQKNISNNHLDIGVGTGYYLKKCHFPPSPDLSLLDINPHNLHAANHKVKSLNPTRYQADIFKPQTFLNNRFDSVSMINLLHCLPGDMRSKTKAIKHAVDMLKSNGILFGTTIISDSTYHTNLSMMISKLYNEKGVFSNEFDSLRALKHALSRYLDNIEVEVKGCVALFKGRKK